MVEKLDDKKETALEELDDKKETALEERNDKEIQRNIGLPEVLSLMSLQLSTSPRLEKSERISSWVIPCGR